MREFRLRRPGGPDADEDRASARADSIMREWEIEDANAAWISATAFGPAALGFACVVLLLALTLAVTLDLRVGLALAASGLLLGPVALMRLRRAVLAHRRPDQLAAEDRATDPPGVAEGESER